ncbi:unnamed protein product, partial [Symbiodinium sp. CCMP2456]
MAGGAFLPRTPQWYNLRWRHPARAVCVQPHPREIVAHALASFAQRPTDLVPRAKQLLPIARRTWQLLEPIDPRSPIQAMLIYTDGSYCPQLQHASWSAVITAQQENRPCKIGALAGKVPPSDGPASAFRAEVWALLHAVAYVAANGIMRATIASDCQSALDIVFGVARCDPSDKAGRAAQSLLLLARAQGSVLCPLKVEAHCGLPLNEAADAVAKTANQQQAHPDFSFEAPDLLACIADGTVERLWMIHAHQCMPAQLPHLGDSGEWGLPSCNLSPATRATSVSFCTQPPECEQWQLALNLITYNCLSARSRAAKALLDQGLHHRQCALAGLQETRDLEEGVQTTEHYWVVSSGCDKSGAGGCQVWISKCLPWARAGEQMMQPARDSICVLFASPQLLIVLFRVGTLKVACVVAHAPTSTAPQPVIDQWWKDLREANLRVPPGHIRICMIDANASFESHPDNPSTIEATPSGANSSCFQAFCQDFCLCPSAQRDVSGNRLFSWTSPGGELKRLIDYVCVPDAWKEGFATMPNFCLGDIRAGFDHSPVQGRLRAQIEAPPARCPRRFCVESFHTPEGRAAAATALATMPQVPWEVDATTHLDCLLRHAQACLSAHLPAPVKKPRNPAISDKSLELILTRRRARTVRDRLRCQLTSTLLYHCFAAWRGRTGHSASRLMQIAGLADRTAKAAFSYCALNKAVHDGLAADRAAFARRAIDHARGMGSAEFAHHLRAVLRTGRRYRAPQLLRPLQCDAQTAQTAACDTDILAALGKHFAAPERAALLPSSELAAKFDGATPLAEGTDFEKLPTLSDLAAGVLALKPRKAAGVSGLAAELFRADALASAAVLFPCWPRRRSEAQVQRNTTGGKLQASNPGGWRSILLLEPSAKIIQQAYRPQLIAFLEGHKSRCQFGGLPNRRLEQPSAIVRSHFAMLRATAQVGGAVFIDSRAAYYSIIRDSLVASRVELTTAELRCRAQALFPFSDDQESYVRHMQAGGIVRALQLPEPLVRYLESQLGTTWFSMANPINAAYVADSGTAPGSPIADVLFSFVYARFLTQAEDLLIQEGHYVRLCTTQSPEAVPTWADDTAFLLGPIAPVSLAPSLRRVAEIICGGLRQAGLEPNLSPGKTEAVIHFGGPGHQACRRALLCVTNPGVTFSQDAERSGHLRVVPQYAHLGTIISYNGAEGPNLLHRAALMRQIFKPVRSRLFYNPHLSLKEKRRFLYGAGLWCPRTAHEAELVVDPIHTAMRKSFRPLLGLSSAGFSNDEVAAALQMPTPAERLHHARASALLVLLETGSAETWANYEADGTWLSMAWRLCKSYLRTCVAQRAPVQLSERNPEEASRLAVHLARMHRIRSKAASTAWGTRCERCQTEFWDVARLSEHLRYRQDTASVAARYEGSWAYALLGYAFASCGDLGVDRN